MKPTIIFDLGGVILPLNVEASKKKIIEYTGKDIQEWIKFGYPHQLIQQFELGKVTEKEFFEELKDLLSFNQELYYLKEAWNAMLMLIPVENINYLKQLSEKYQLILLSNTCETHIHCFEKMLQDYHEIESLEVLFDKVYFSCHIGLRKPDTGIFQKLIKENELDLNQTVYFDDTIEHIEVAKKMGITSYLYPQNNLLINILPKLLTTHQKTLVNL